MKSGLSVIISFFYWKAFERTLRSVSFKFIKVNAFTLKLKSSSQRTAAVVSLYSSQLQWWQLFTSQQSIKTFKQSQNNQVVHCLAVCLIYSKHSRKHDSYISRIISPECGVLVLELNFLRPEWHRRTVFYSLKTWLVTCKILLFQVLVLKFCLALPHC